MEAVSILGHYVQAIVGVVSIWGHYVQVITGTVSISGRRGCGQYVGPSSPTRLESRQHMEGGGAIMSSGRSTVQNAWPLLSDGLVINN